MTFIHPVPILITMLPSQSQDVNFIENSHLSAVRLEVPFYKLINLHYTSNVLSNNTNCDVIQTYVK